MTPFLGGHLNRRWTPYCYGRDNPIRFIDPDGMDGQDVSAALQNFQDQHSFSDRDMGALFADGDISITAGDGVTGGGGSSAGGGGSSPSGGKGGADKNTGKKKPAPPQPSKPATITPPTPSTAPQVDKVGHKPLPTNVQPIQKPPCSFCLPQTFSYGGDKPGEGVGDPYDPNRPFIFIDPDAMETLQTLGETGSTIDPPEMPDAGLAADLSDKIDDDPVDATKTPVDSRQPIKMYYNGKPAPNAKGPGQGRKLNLAGGPDTVLYSNPRKKRYTVS